MNTFRASAAGASFAAALLCFTPSALMADTLEASSVAPGYTAQSLELGVPFGGSIAADPADGDVLYVSAGTYGEHTILKVNLDDGTTQTVTPLVGNVGGLAVLSNGDLAITDNFDATSDTILRAHDGNGDGDWLDAGEITELIQPILVDSTFTGAQMAVAPVGNAAGIPAGSLLVQTADGTTNSEILVITNPETSPAYYPAGAAWYSGFQYNGGLAFSPSGDVLCGISEYPAGRIAALVNSNSNDHIEPGEARDILDGTSLVNSISGLGASSDNKIITTENSGIARLFNLPADLQTGTAFGETVLAETNGTYLSMQLDYSDRPFTAGATAPFATVYLGGFVTYPAATNLLAITATNGPAAASDWELFD